MKWHNSRQAWFDRADRPLHNARKKARYRDDPEAGAAKAAAWRTAHPEQQKQHERNYRERHPEAIKQQNAKWRADNVEYVREKARAYHDANRAELNEERLRRARHTKEVAPWGSCLRARSKKAIFKNIPFDLTDEWARARWTGYCELTGIPFAKTNLYGQFFSPSIDKIEPRKGYLKDNCRFILFAVNAFKGTGTDEDMLRVVKALHARHVQLEPNNP